jgi:DNA-binding beta-propeller fold protein YncE
MTSHASQRRARIVGAPVTHYGSLALLLFVLVLSCMHSRPDAPAVPVGPDSVEPGSPSLFKTWVYGTGQGQPFIRFDWGDGDTSVWCGPGETAKYSHSWSDSGVFLVRSQVHDDRAQFSDWSAPFSVTAVVPPYPYRLIDSVAVPDAPLTEVQVSPDGEFIYIANEFSASLSVVRVSDLRVVAQIPFYAGWWGEGGGGRMVCSPSGEYLYATYYRYDYLAVVRTVGEVVVDSLFLSYEEMLSIAISPDGKRLFVAVGDPRSIVVVRLPDNVVEDSITTLGASYVTSMKVSPDGTRLYVVDQGSESVCSIRLSDKSIEWQVPAEVEEWPSSTLVLSPTGNPLYLLEIERISVRESSTGSLVDTIPLTSRWGGNAEISPDGSFVYVTCSDTAGDRAVAVVSTSNNEVLRLIATPSALYAAPSPDGQKLYVTGDNGKLYVLGR